MTRGTTIDCALITRLDSSIPGPSGCQVTRDIYSSDGSTILIERGSRVTGEYVDQLQQGRARLFVLWNRIETPGGVVIDLESPATDSLGAAGVPGHTQTYFRQRIGGALLLSLIDDLAGIVSARVAASDTQHSNAQVIVGGTANISADLASELLRSTIHSLSGAFSAVERRYSLPREVTNHAARFLSFLASIGSVGLSPDSRNLRMGVLQSHAAIRAQVGPLGPPDLVGCS